MQFARWPQWPYVDIAPGKWLKVKELHLPNTESSHLLNNTQRDEIRQQEEFISQHLLEAVEDIPSDCLLLQIHTEEE